MNDSVIYSNTIAGWLLRCFRKRANLSQADVAHSTGNQATISRWETGRYELSFNNMWQWVEMCGAPPSQFSLAFSVALEAAKVAGYTVAFGCPPRTKPGVLDFTSMARGFAEQGFAFVTSPAVLPNPFSAHWATNSVSADKPASSPLSSDIA